jgi:hypothetical protein
MLFSINLKTNKLNSGSKYFYTPIDSFNIYNLTFLLPWFCLKYVFTLSLHIRPSNHHHHHRLYSPGWALTSSSKCRQRTLSWAAAAQFLQQVFLASSSTLSIHIDFHRSLHCSILVSQVISYSL